MSWLRLVFVLAGREWVD